MSLFNKTLIFISFLLLIISCSSKTDPVTGEKIIIEPNAEKRAIIERDKGGGIFGDINNRKKESNNFDFATSNSLWRATLDRKSTRLNSSH